MREPSIIDISKHGVIMCATEPKWTKAVCAYYLDFSNEFLHLLIIAFFLYFRLLGSHLSGDYNIAVSILCTT